MRAGRASTARMARKSILRKVGGLRTQAATGWWLGALVIEFCLEMF